MKTFFSWSGGKSHQVAIAFSNWLPCVLQAVEPWVSSEDIDRGAIWLNEIKDTNFGVVFVTRENQEKPWLLFESGALSKGLTENRVCTVLIDLKVRDIDSGSPIKHLNHTTLEKSEVFKLLETINKNLDGGKVQDTRLKTSFDALWPTLETQLSDILQSNPASIEPERDDKDVLNDILENVLSINKRVSRQNMKSGRFIEPHQAEALLKRLMKLALERDEIEETMEDFAPSHWVAKQLDEIYGPQED